MVYVVGSKQARITKQDLVLKEKKRKEREKEGRREMGGREKGLLKEIMNNQETINTVRTAVFEQRSGKLLWQLVGDEGKRLSKAKMQNFKADSLLTRWSQVIN